MIENTNGITSVFFKLCGKTLWSGFSLYRTNLIISFIFLIIISVYCLPYVLTFDPYSASEHLLYPPSFISTDAKHYFLGTDDLGRDVLSRLVFGARNTLSVGFFVVIFSLIIGSILGLLASVYGSFLDFIIRYFTDMVMSFPNILL